MSVKNPRLDMCQMDDKQETSTAIIAEMCGGQIPRHRHDRELLNHYAYRLQAALKREKAAIEADALAVGGIVAATAEKSSAVDTKFELCNYPEQVLKIGRDFQNKDGFRGAHYDTVKLLCDTIEHQQEQLKTKTEVGNAAKLREALIRALTMLAVCEWPDGTNMEGVEELRRDIDAALDVPPRNCDIGTANEQSERYHEFCDSHAYCSDCPLFKAGGCEFAWAQMPFSVK